jgi:glycosyltransferase involved in cell wall biosynthesis
MNATLSPVSPIRECGKTTRITGFQPVPLEHGQDARDTKMRILFTIPGLHRVNRGAEVVMEEVARRAAATHKVTLIGSGRPRAGEPYRFLHAPCVSRERFEKFPMFPYARDVYQWEEISFAPGLMRQYRPHDYDVTVTCGYPYSNFVLRARRKSKRPPHVFVTQNGDWMVQAKNAEYKHFSCDGLICTNPEYYERHKERYHCALIPNGVNVDLFKPGKGDREQFGLRTGAPLVLIVSALIASKRVLDGIRSVASLKDACLVVAGDGEQRSEVDALARQLMGDRFKRLVLPRAEMPELYRCADVLLHMSQDEPFGNIYIEALASGLPVVAHDSPVTRWILQDRAILTDTSNMPAVGDALIQALRDTDMKQAAARRELAVRRFSWESVAQRYCEFFEDVCRRHTS